MISPPYIVPRAHIATRRRERGGRAARAGHWRRRRRGQTTRDGTGRGAIQSGARGTAVAGPSAVGESDWREPKDRTFGSRFGEEEESDELGREREGRELTSIFG